MGSIVGAAVGLKLGFGVGAPAMYVGAVVGVPDGAAVGLTVGKGVGAPLV